MKSHILVAALAACVSCLPLAAQAEEEHRQLGSHVHGRGTLAIAIEGNDVLMELHAPGADIVGFEHEANGPEQNALLEAARKALENDVLMLFVLPGAAGCKVASSKLDIVIEEPGGDEPIEGDQPSDHAADEEHGRHHGEFQATYGLACADATKLASIDFPFFDRFANARELDVTIIDSRGQEAYEVSRDSRRLERSTQ